MKTNLLTNQINFYRQLRNHIRFFSCSNRNFVKMISYFIFFLSSKYSKFFKYQIPFCTPVEVELKLNELIAFLVVTTCSLNYSSNSFCWLLVALNVYRCIWLYMYVWVYESVCVCIWHHSIYNTIHLSVYCIALSGYVFAQHDGSCSCDSWNLSESDSISCVVNFQYIKFSLPSIPN